MKLLELSSHSVVAAMCQHYLLVVVATVLCCSLSERFCLAKISPAERNEIVGLHNALRASVTPSASNMEKMVGNIIMSVQAIIVSL